MASSSTTTTVTPQQLAAASAASAASTNTTSIQQSLSAGNSPAATPPISRSVQSVQTPPTPTDYEIMTESCDWCLAETPWDDGDLLFGSSSSSSPPPSSSNDENYKAVPEVPPRGPLNKQPQEESSVNLRPRQAFGISIM